MPPVPLRINRFGGLNRVSPPSEVPSGDCLDCENVHTAYGSLDVRPGYLAWLSSSILTGYPNMAVRQIFSVTLNRAAYVLVHAHDGTASWLGLFAPSQATPVISEIISPGVSWCVPAVYANRLYVPLGLPANGRKIFPDASQAWHSQRIGLPAPTGTISLASDTSGTLPVGTYSYRATSYNATADVESGPCAAAQLVLASIGRIEINLSALAHSDPQATTYRIYRKLVGTDSTWYFLAAATGPNYFDNGSVTPDYTFDGEIKLVTDIPPSSLVAAHFKRRLWWTNGPSGSAMRWSEVDEPESVNPLNSLQFGDASERIHGTAELWGRLIVFKQNSIWFAAGSSPQSWVSQVLDPSIGCAGPNSIVLVGDSAYFLGYRAFYKLTPGGAVPISTALGDLRDLMLPSRFYRTTVCFDRVRNLIIWNTYNMSSAPTQWVYHLGAQRFTRWTMPFEAIGQLEATYDTTYYTALLGGWYTAPPNAVFVGRIEGNTDGASAINWTWTMPPLTAGTRRQKRIFFMGIETQAPAAVSGDNVNLSYDDGDGTFTQVGSISLPTYKQGRTLRIGRRATRPQFKLAGSSASGVRIAALEPDMLPAGPR